MPVRSSAPSRPRRAGLSGVEWPRTATARLRSVVVPVPYDEACSNWPRSNWSKSSRRRKDQTGYDRRWLGPEAAGAYMVEHPEPRAAVTGALALSGLRR